MRMTEFDKLTTVFFLKNKRIFCNFLKKVNLCSCCKKNEGTIQYLSVENMEESDDDDYDFDDVFGDCDDNSPC